MVDLNFLRLKIRVRYYLNIILKFNYYGFCYYCTTHCKNKVTLTAGHCLLNLKFNI